MSKWISVEEELPLEGQWVILGGGDVGAEQGFYHCAGKFLLTRTVYNEYVEAFPTHWQPLPDPPTDMEQQ